jgi:hypothetical protein
MRWYKVVIVLVVGVMLSARTLYPQIVNGDFETGDFTGWTVSGPHSANVEQHQGSYTAHIYISSGNASNSWTPNDMWERVAQVVTIPTAVCSLSFYMEVSGYAWHDGGSVWLEDTLGNFITFLFQTGGGGGSGQYYPWEQHKVDLSPYAGQTVNLCFGGHNWNGFGDHICDIWFDNVEILLSEPESLSPEVTVISPNGGEALTVGQTYTITWYAYDSSGVVLDSVFFSNDAGLHWELIYATQGNPGSFDWTVPNTPSEECLIKVVAIDPWGNRGEDQSDNFFSIVPDTVPPSVTVTVPNGGESWGTLTYHIISWEASDNIGVVADSIYYSTDAGATWIPVAYQTGNPGSYTWLVPNTPSNQCLVKVKVFDEQGLSASDQSDDVFTIYPYTPPPYKYAIVVSQNTYNDPGWQAVVESLIVKHNGQVFIYSSSIYEIQEDLSLFRPDYIAFVCQVSEASPSFVQTVWPFTRSLDDDPYGDAIWGIITGCEPEDVINKIGPQHLEIRTVLGEQIPLSYYPQGISTNEVEYGHYSVKYPDSLNPVQYTDGPTDRTGWLVDMLNGDSLIFGDYVDIFYTSGHANYDVWQLHYPDAGLEGYFRSDDFGHLYGDPYSGPDIDIVSPYPKIYFGIGNCDIGQIWGTHCMAPAWIRNGGAYLFSGYVIPEGSYSYQLGATQAYFVYQNHYPWPVAFFLGNQVFKFDLDNNTPGIGSPPDFDGAALYGDPALDARIPDSGVVIQPLLYTTVLTFIEGGEWDTFTFRIVMNVDGQAGFDVKCGHRSQIFLLPFRVDSPKVI